MDCSTKHTQILSTPPAGALTSFDYGDLSSRDQQACDRDAEKIVQHELKGLALLVAQGGLLKQVQGRLANHDHGMFREWIKAKCPFSHISLSALSIIIFCEFLGAGKGDACTVAQAAARIARQIVVTRGDTGKCPPR